MSEPALLEQFQECVERACRKAGRNSATLKLLAVSKGQSLERIETFLSAGLKHWALGESYLEELAEKQRTLSLPSWHFIGRLQSRKIPEILERCEVLHSVSRTKELDLIARRPRDFFVQVRVSGEDTKNGLLPAELPAFLDHAESLGLSKQCLGLMALPSPLDEVGESQVRTEMTMLRELRARHLPQGLLNMGTSADYELAIAEGADVLRIGSLLFGERGARSEV